MRLRLNKTGKLKLIVPNFFKNKQTITVIFEPDRITPWLWAATEAKFVLTFVKIKKLLYSFHLEGFEVEQLCW